LAGLIASPAVAQNFEAGVDLNYLGIAHSEGQAIGFGFNAAPELWVRFNAPSGLYYGLKYGADLANGRGWYASGGLTAKLWNGVSDGASENTSAYGFKLTVGMNF